MAKTVLCNGETWNLVSLGVVRRDDGKIHAHLSHPSRGRAQKNGFRPEQVCDFIDWVEPESNA